MVEKVLLADMDPVDLIRRKKSLQKRLGVDREVQIIENEIAVLGALQNI